MTKIDRKKRQLAARKVRRDLEAIDPTECHQQRQSPLFGVLPPELRNIIFQLVLREEPDPTRLYRYGRGRYGGTRWECQVKILHLELLRTCRIVYYETESLPMRLSPIIAFHPFVDVHSGEYGVNMLTRLPFRFDYLTKKHQRQLKEVHLFAGTFGQLRESITHRLLTPRILYIMFRWRHYDDRVARYLQPFTEVRYSDKLEELHIRIFEQGSGTAENPVIQELRPRAAEFSIKRKDDRRLDLVQIVIEPAGTLEGTPDWWYCTHFLWRLSLK